ncbi:MAG: hypothetical protein IJZ16_08525 [Clostridia bacterium]|nr:hypothetical protein [Clostridia bacterium]
MRNIIIIGGDKRQKYLKEYLESKGYNVASYGLFDWDDDSDKLKGMIGEDSVIILPLPATRNDKTIVMPFSKREITIDRLMPMLSENNIVFGGIIKGELLSRLRETEIMFYDYYDNEFIEKNAVLTAFGALKILLEHIDFALPLGKYAITGYGRVAREVASVLAKLSCDVTVFARSDFQRTDAILKGLKAQHIDDLSSQSHNFDVIINTVPDCVINENTIKNMNKNCKIMELASPPYGLDFETARKYSVDVIKAFSLPGKYTPKTAGEIIGRKICNTLQKEE